MQHDINVFSQLSIEAKNIFSLIQKTGPISKKSLIDITHMKLTTLNRVMSSLENLTLLTDECIGKSTGGRRPLLYDVNKKDYVLIGVDLSRTYIQVVMTNMKLEILNKKFYTMDKTSSPSKVIKIIINTIKEMTNTANGAYLAGIGFGTVGPLDREAGIIKNPANFPSCGWSNVSVKKPLETEFSCPVIVDNGANTAVLSEWLFGCGKAHKSIAYFNCGIGIRTGVISSGKIIRCINDAEDAFGHMVIDVDGLECTCGNFGCIECYSSILAVTNKFVSELKKGRVSEISKKPDQITFTDICTAADNGDELSTEVISSAANILGIGLANYINLLNPSMVILSGPMVKNSKLFYNTSKNVALKKLYLKENSNTVFSRMGSFSDVAISTGAAAIVLETLLGNT